MLYIVFVDWLLFFKPKPLVKVFPMLFAIVELKYEESATSTIYSISDVLNGGESTLLKALGKVFS